MSRVCQLCRFGRRLCFFEACFLSFGFYSTVWLRYLISTIYFVVLLSFCIFVTVGYIKSVLKEMYPGKTEYSSAEMALARRVIAATLRSSPRSSRFPSVFVPVGGVYYSSGVPYRCIDRPKGLAPRDCCRGCAFNAPDIGCPAALQCSRFDRQDGHFVWFVREDGV